MTTTPTTAPASDHPADRAVGLDALLVDAALGRVRWLTRTRRLPPPYRSRP